MKDKMAASHGSGPQSPPSIGRPVDRVFEDAQFTGEIILNGRKLRDFPKICNKYDLSDTVHVDISRNRLTDVPGEVCSYIYVERFNCYHNVIRSIPDAISQMQALTHLNLSRNQLTVLPPGLCMLSSLEVLLVSNNKLVSLPEEIGQLENLMDLDVSCNEISHLPLQIGDLSSLRSLNLRRNFLVELPVEISRLHLYKLDFSSNRIEKIPTVFRKMETLQQLIQANNPLTSPPAYICTKGKQHIMKYLHIESIKEDRKRGIMVSNDFDLKRVTRKSLPPQSSEELRGIIGGPDKWKRHTVLSSDSGYSTGDGEKNGWHNNAESWSSDVNHSWGGGALKSSTVVPRSNQPQHRTQSNYVYPPQPSHQHLPPPPPPHPATSVSATSVQSSSYPPQNHHQPLKHPSYPQQELLPPPPAVSQKQTNERTSTYSAHHLSPPNNQYQQQQQQAYHHHKEDTMGNQQRISSPRHQSNSSTSSSSSTLSPGPTDFPQYPSPSPSPTTPPYNSSHRLDSSTKPPLPPPQQESSRYFPYSSSTTSTTTPQYPPRHHKPQYQPSSNDQTYQNEDYHNPIRTYVSPQLMPYPTSINLAESGLQSPTSPRTPTSTYPPNLSPNSYSHGGNHMNSSTTVRLQYQEQRQSSPLPPPPTNVHVRQWSHSSNTSEHSLPPPPPSLLSPSPAPSLSGSQRSNSPYTSQYGTADQHNDSHSWKYQNTSSPFYGSGHNIDTNPPPLPEERNSATTTAFRYPSQQQQQQQHSHIKYHNNNNGPHHHTFPPPPPPPASSSSSSSSSSLSYSSAAHHHPLHPPSPSGQGLSYIDDEDHDTFDKSPSAIRTGSMEVDFTRELKRQKADYERRKKEAEEIKAKQMQQDQEEREKEECRRAAIKLQEEQKRQEELRKEETRKQEELKQQQQQQQQEEMRKQKEEMMMRRKKKLEAEEEEEEARKREEEVRKLQEAVRLREAEEAMEKQRHAEEIQKVAAESKLAEESKKSKLSSKNALSSQSFKDQNRRLANSTQYRRTASDGLKKSTPSPATQVEALNHINKNGGVSSSESNNNTTTTSSSSSRLSSASTTPSVSPSPSPSSSISYLARPSSHNSSPHSSNSHLAKPSTSTSTSAAATTPGTAHHSNLAKPSPTSSSSHLAKPSAGKSSVPRASPSTNGPAGGASQVVRRTKLAAGDRSNTSSPVTARSTRTAQGSTGLRPAGGGTNSLAPGGSSNIRRSSNSSTTDEERGSNKSSGGSANSTALGTSRLKSSRLEEPRQRTAVGGQTSAVRKLGTPDNDNKRINTKPPTSTYGSNRTRPAAATRSSEDGHTPTPTTPRNKEEYHREEAEQMDRLRQTVETRLKVTLPDNLAEALRDGVVLCHLANQIRPRSVGSIHVPSPAVPKLTLAKCRRNVDNFLEACRKIGVGQEQICNAQDILEERGIARVAITVAALVAIGTNPKQSAV